MGFCKSLLGVALGCIWLAACAGTQKTETSVSESDEGKKQQKAPSGSAKKPEEAARQPRPEDQFSGKALRLFDDALRTWDEQKKLNVYDWQLLEKRFKAVIDADSRFAEAHYNLGVIYERQHKVDDAKSAYKTALNKKPSLKQAAENLAVIMQNENKPADAVAIYQELLRKYPDDGAARARMAEIYRETGDMERAMRFARDALMREPQNMTAYKVMMRFFLERNNLSMAKLVAMRATRLSPDPELFYTIGQIALKEGDEQLAISNFKRSIKERDDYALARIALADINIQHRDWTAAASQYSKILQYDPKNAVAHVNLGVAYKGSGQIDKAMAEYDAAIKADSGLATSYYYTGLIFQKHKDAPDKAIEYYKKFVSASRDTIPAQHPVHDNIKECEQYIKQLAEAKAAEDRAKAEEKVAKARAEKEAADKKKADDKKASDDKKADEKKAEEKKIEAKKADDKKKAEEAKRNESKRAENKPADSKGAKGSKPDVSDEPVDKL